MTRASSEAALRADSRAMRGGHDNAKIDHLRRANIAAPASAELLGRLRRRERRKCS